MKKILVLLVFGLLVGAAVSEASVGATQKRMMGKGITTIILTMPSQAQNAIDTSYVDISDAAWSQLANSTIGSSMVVLEATVAAVFGASQDSVNTQIGHGLIGDDWVDDYALANTGSNLTTSAPSKAIQFAIPARMLRVIVKNVDATTGAAKVAICYPSVK